MLELITVENEEWRPIVAHIKYEISNYGRVRHVENRKILKPTLKKSGYLVFETNLRGFKFQKYLHKEVAKAFIGPKPENKSQTSHNDGNVYNNTVWNIKYKTALENQKDRELHGTTCKGIKNGMSKLTEEQVKEIRSLKNILSSRAIAKKFNVEKTIILDIWNNLIWKHIS